MSIVSKAICDSAAPKPIKHHARGFRRDPRYDICHCGDYRREHKMAQWCFCGCKRYRHSVTALREMATGRIFSRDGYVIGHAWETAAGRFSSLRTGH